MLVKAGAKLEERDKQDFTPLMVAANTKGLAAARMLLRLGADTLATRADKGRTKTALDYALEYRPVTPDSEHVALTEMLRQATHNDAVRNSKKSLEVFVVQNQKRTRLDGRPLTLKRAPFSLVFELKNGNTVLAHSSLDSRLTSQLLKGNTLGTTFCSKWDAGAESTTASSQEMFVYGDDHGHQIWWQAAEGTRFDMFETREDTNVATRVIKTIAVIQSDPRQDQKIARIEEFSAPLFLTFAVTESMGLLEQAVVQFRHAEIQWKK
jgi:hypothetical protein